MCYILSLVYSFLYITFFITMFVCNGSNKKFDVAQHDRIIATSFKLY